MCAGRNRRPDTAHPWQLMRTPPVHDLVGLGDVKKRTGRSRAAMLGGDDGA